MSSLFGHLFRVSTFGESHGGAVGVVIDGCPPRLDLDVEYIQRELDRRRPGRATSSAPRQEHDRAEILSGVFSGKTLGTPIAIVVRNEDQRPEAYVEIKDKFRPSHADFTYEAKFGLRAWAGGGRASARETVGRVAAAAVARQVIRHSLPAYECLAWVERVRDIDAPVEAAVRHGGADRSESGPRRGCGRGGTDDDVDPRDAGGRELGGRRGRRVSFAGSLRGSASRFSTSSRPTWPRR